MASYTANYGLHQWEASDSFLRTDFNADLQKIDAAIAGRGDCLQVVGTYAGTGKYGSASRNTLHFPFKPLAVMVVGGSYRATSLFLRPGTKGATNDTAGMGGVVVLSWGEDSLSWYADGWANGGSTSTSTDAECQLNESGKTYTYLALGASE